MEHVLEYARQFKIIYDPMRDVLLAPLNECRKRKFICTTIRPTKLPYTELYDYEGCASFVANYFEYEELAVPNKLPTYIPSPANVLNWQAGDCFDLAIVLCSLLIGTGYDAYVVYGNAPKAITTKDESVMECPFNTDFNDEMSDEDPEIDQDQEHMEEKKEAQPDPLPGFNVLTKKEQFSEFDTKPAQEEADRKRMEELKAITVDDDEPDLEMDDEYDRQRLHAWVLI